MVLKSEYTLLKTKNIIVAQQVRLPQIYNRGSIGADSNAKIPNTHYDSAYRKSTKQTFGGFVLCTFFKIVQTRHYRTF